MVGKKVAVGARVSRSLDERLERLAKADHRTKGNLIELLMLRGLPEMEVEVLGESQEAPEVPA